MIKQHVEDFKALEIASKIFLIGFWITASGAALLLCTSVITVACWMQGNEPDSGIKKALMAGLGLAVGGAIFTVGAAMEDERQCNLNSENIRKKIEKRRALRDASPCPNCKYFSDDSDLYCALNPVVACTPEANNCSDFESNELV